MRNARRPAIMNGKRALIRQKTRLCTCTLLGVDERFVVGLALPECLDYPGHRVLIRCIGNKIETFFWVFAVGVGREFVILLVERVEVV